MKNDLDFIRDKIENSGVNAPADMDEKYAADTLEGVYPKLSAAQEPKRKHKGWKIAISATAAALVLTLTTGIILHSTGVFGSTRSVDLPGGLSLRQFSSHEQVKKEIAGIRKKQNTDSFLGYFTDDYRLDGGDYAIEEYAAADSNSSAGSSTGSMGSGSATGSSGFADGSFSETYKQVEGVDEADIIKTDGRYIYCVQNSYPSESRIKVFSAEGENSRKVTDIRVFSDLKGATADEADADFDYDAYYYKVQSIEEIYLRGDRLIAVCDDTANSEEDYVTLTRVVVYDISDIEHITLLDSMVQSGGYRSSRMIGDRLYTVSSYYPYGDRIIPVCGSGANPESVPADCIYSPPENNSEDFLVISAYDTLDYTEQTESKAILGAVDDLYCNEDHMYIYTTDWGYSYYSGWDYGADESHEINSRILKVDLTDGIAFTAYTEVEGQIDDQYALDEYNGNLRVATTTYDYAAYDYAGGEDTNNLFVLDENLNQIGSVTGFAEGESIKAVRYLGDTAYVITYEQTDPLFVIDLSEPTAPAILGEVKISGFSTMLVPVDDNTMLGIGYHTENEDYTTMEVQEGLKLALFDVSDKANPQVLDSISYVNCSSAVQYNPKALVYNPERSDYVIPLNYADWGHYDSATGEYVYDEEYYGGMLNFKVQDGKLTEIDRVSTDYFEVERCVYVGDYIYMTYYDDYSEYDLQLDCVPYH
ncbi:MAG: beta-propeller domain-containing protein [Ruminococcus sp.]|nr:beta-propeller domain-containing protein [Ruminococcus sp.]